MNTKRLTLLFFVCFFFSVPAIIHTQTMHQYCSVPPYATRTVPPNITIIIDNSSNMLQQAYTGHFDPSKPNDYTGYFKYDKKYCASNNGFYEATKCKTSDRGPYDGSLLNWATMSKYDILMQVLMGGIGSPSPSSRDKLAGVSTDWSPRTTGGYPGCLFDVTPDGGLIISSNGGCRLPLTKKQTGTPIVVTAGNESPRGIIQNLIDKDSDGNWDSDAPRISIMRFDAQSNDVRMEWCAGNTGTLSSLMNRIADKKAQPDKSSANAPLNRAITRAIDYYKNKCGASCSCGDPFDSVRCRKNFVLTISGGNATDISGIDSLMHKIRESHVSDIRNDLPETQVIDFYSVDILSSSEGRDILQAIAKNGGFVDANGNRAPDLQSEWDKDHDGIPDTYYEALDAEGIAGALETAFHDILVRTTSGTAVSNFCAQSKTAGSIQQAYFLPVRYEGIREVLWTGYLQGLWLDRDSNTREDSTPDYRLILDQDMVAKYYVNPETKETEAALFTTRDDGTGGSLAECVSSKKVPLEDVKVLYEAGLKLHKMSPSDRTIFTSKKIIHGTRTISEIPGSPYPEFKTGNKNIFTEVLSPDATYTSENIIRYIRGECLETGTNCGDACCGNSTPVFRDRRVDAGGGRKVWKLGDVMNSSPKIFSGTPLNSYHLDYADRSYYDFISDATYRQKSAVAFVGANDGMLHAFRAGYIQGTGLFGKIKAMFRDAGDSLGEEMWAFIPYNAFPYLKYLARPDYCHIYYSDLTVRLADASIGGQPEATRNKGSWRTIIIGGMRFGGAGGPGGSPALPPGSSSEIGYSSYFALDVTDPEKPLPLWEFSDPDLGYASGTPAIVRTGDREKNGTWYAVFGSGSKTLPKGGVDIRRNKPGYIYFLDLKTGELVKKAKIGGSAIVGDILAVDENMDYASEKIYFGTAYQGSSKWNGQLISMDVPYNVGLKDDASSYTVLFSGNYPFTASPEAARDTKGNVWVYAGSGKYYSDIDEMDKAEQIFIGMKDYGVTVEKKDLSDVTGRRTEGEKSGTEKICVYDPDYKGFRLKEVVTSINLLSGRPSEPSMGWVLSMKNGERVLSRPLVIGGLVDFLSYQPDEDPCNYGGSSNLYSVAYTTGTAPPNIAVRSPEIVTGHGDGLVTVNIKIPLGSGAPPTAEAIMTSRAGETELLRKKIQLATGSVAEVENNPTYSILSRVMHWLKK